MTVWHYMSLPGVTACGADYPNLAKTDALENVTCGSCLDREREDGIPTPRVSVLLVPSLGGMTALEDAIAARYDEATKLTFEQLARRLDPPITLDEAEVEIGRAIVEAVSPLVSNLPKPEVYVRRNNDNPETVDVTIKVRPLGWAKAEENEDEEG